MGKSVYSLVLSDEIIAQIDRAAYSRALSRSALINQVLADFVSYDTPERHISRVIGGLEEYFVSSSVFRVLAQPSVRMFSVGSPLLYKYNPTVRYALELFPDSGKELGELRVNMRTQNPELLIMFRTFFKMWTEAERDCGAKPGTLGSDARFFRRFSAGGEVRSSDYVTKAIAAYIDLLDSTLKLFFSSPDSPGNPAAARQNIFGFRRDYPEII